MNKYICIHGHFYQPPRENPWLEEVEGQDSAYPFHDWNERITAECYAPNTAARILGPHGEITDITSNYSKISMNFGPTLLSWMERREPDIYQAILDADTESQKRFDGHGSALAQSYNHMIMPLANRRDKVTQVIWGIKDFERHYKRKPEGMWLAETAVDLETLDIMAEAGILFTILAPRQAKRFKKIDENKWTDLQNEGLDPRRPYLCRLPSGKTIALFFYDGPVSQAVAFENLLESGEKFASRLVGVFDGEKHDQLVHIATDGETYGHHHPDGDMALAYGMHYIESQNLAKLTIYGEYLAKHPPEFEAEIIENSSWSCVHGVERWRDDCGCHSGGHADWNQQWRAPLRGALDWLRDNLISVFENEMKPYCQDPWSVREHYIDLINDRSSQNVAAFMKTHFSQGLSQEETVKILQLLEMQRHAMLMYTSCGWFFDEVSGIETVQILAYASRAIQLSEAVNQMNLETTFINLLERVPSNIPEFQNAKNVYQKFVKPAKVDLLRVGAHYAISSILEDYRKREHIYSYKLKSEKHDFIHLGKQNLAVGKVRVISTITQETTLVSYAVLHFGDHNFIGGVRPFMDDEKFDNLNKEVKAAFERSDIPLTIKAIEKYFEEFSYSLWDLFRDEQTKILYQVLDSSLDDVEKALRRINDNHMPMVQVLKSLDIPLPKVLASTYQTSLNTELLRALTAHEIDYTRINEVVQEIKRCHLEVDEVTLKYHLRERINHLVSRLRDDFYNVSVIERCIQLFDIFRPLGLNLDLWKAQNVYFSISRNGFKKYKKEGKAGDQQAGQWVEKFRQLGKYLNVHLPS